jgi:citrate lyase synthetase
MIHCKRNAEVHLKCIFRLENLFNALRARKIISIYTATRSFEHFSERGLTNVERQSQELKQLEAKSTELQSFRNLICTRFRHEIILLFKSTIDLVMFTGR